MKRRTGVLIFVIVLACVVLKTMRETHTPVRSVSVPTPVLIEQPGPVVSTLPDSENRKIVPPSAPPLSAEENPRATFLHLIKHGIGRSDTHRALSAFRQWAGIDFAAAFDEAERQPPGIAREELFGSLALIVAQASPAEAAAMAEQDMVPGPVRMETALSILHQWAVTDLEQAAVWAATFPQGPQRERAIRELEGVAVSFFPRTETDVGSRERADGRSVLP